MPTKNVRDLKMISAAALAIEARTKAAVLVDREEDRSRSRMRAYDNVGEMVGRSGSWVRQFVGGHLEKCSDVLVWMNIVNAYDRLCTCAERYADRLETPHATASGSVANSKGARAPRDEG